MFSHFFVNPARRDVAELRAELEEKIRGKIGNLTQADLTSSSGNLQVNPDYQWTANEVDSSMLDPEYNPNKGKTPRLSKYRNQGYFTVWYYRV